MRNKKYGYTGKTIKWCGRVYRQIVALQDISPNVHKGDIGGYVEHGGNLSDRGRCWIDVGCVIGGNVRVSETANVHNTFILGGEGSYIRIGGFSEITNCEFGTSSRNVLIVDTIMTNTYIEGECVVSLSTIDDSDIKNSCVAECVIADSDIDDTVIFNRNFKNDRED